MKNERGEVTAILLMLMWGTTLIGTIFFKKKPVTVYHVGVHYDGSTAYICQEKPNQTQGENENEKINGLR